MKPHPWTIEMYRPLFTAIIQIDIQPSRKADNKLVQIKMSMCTSILTAGNIINIKDPLDFKRDMIFTL